jgi:hypothetical protein
MKRQRATKSAPKYKTKNIRAYYREKISDEKYWISAERYPGAALKVPESTHPAAKDDTVKNLIGRTIQYEKTKPSPLKQKGAGTLSAPTPHLYMLLDFAPTTPPPKRSLSELPKKQTLLAHSIPQASFVSLALKVRPCTQ